MAVIPGVSPNELVRTTWGNAVANELNGNSVRKNGLNAAGTAAEQMTGPLILPTTQSTNANAAVHKGYVDTTFANVTGDTMTGALLLPTTQSTNALAAVHKTYADTKLAEAGGTMTGDLEFGGGGGPGFSGTKINTTGHIDSTTNLNISNLALNRIAAADVSGGAYIHFETGTSGGTSAPPKASITRNAADNGIAISNCNTTAPSDYRLKDDLGPVADAVARIRSLIPRRLRWKQGDDPNEFDGFFAHEVTPAAPYAVVGTKDAVEMQQLDVSGLVPLLTAALQTALATIDELAARVDALEAV